MLAVIKLGDFGDYVRAWQRIVGVPYAQLDAKFGPVTDAKVRAWQAARGIDPDGVVGPLTRSVLKPGDLIAPYEGCVLHAYDDAQDAPLRERLITRKGYTWYRLDGTPIKGFPTIGRGRLLLPGQWIETCTQEEADRWFAEDIENTRMPAVRRWFLATGVEFEAGKVVAACSFAQNCGVGALAKLARTAFDPDWWRTHYTTTKGVESAGLRRRRREEAAMWLAGSS